MVILVIRTMEWIKIKINVADIEGMLCYDKEKDDLM